MQEYLVPETCVEADCGTSQRRSWFLNQSHLDKTALPPPSKFAQSPNVLTLTRSASVSCTGLFRHKLHRDTLHRLSSCPSSQSQQNLLECDSDSQLLGPPSLLEMWELLVAKSAAEDESESSPASLALAATTCSPRAQADENPRCSSVRAAGREMEAIDRVECDEASCEDRASRVSSWRRFAGAAPPLRTMS
jgi:hypothetical protein